MNEFEKIYDELNEIDKRCIEAYRSARQFRNIAKQPIIILDGKFVPVIVAGIVDKALSCELFIKSIIILEKKTIHSGHKLNEILEETTILPVLKERMSNFDFDKELIKISNSFIEWRYIYERDGVAQINIVFLDNLCDNLEEIAREKILESYKLNMLESFL